MILRHHALVQNEPTTASPLSLTVRLPVSKGHSHALDGVADLRALGLSLPAR